MAKKHIHPRESQPFAEYPLSFFACPHPDCADFPPQADGHSKAG